MSKALALAACMAAASCGGGSQAAPPAASASAPVAAAPAAEACALVTRAEVEQILGAPLAEPQKAPGAGSADVSFTQCTFASPAGDKTLTLGLRVSKKGDGQPEYARQVMVDSGVKVEDVAGLGDVAFWTGMQLQAFRGKTVQIVISVFGFDKPKDAAVEVARRALAKL